MKKYACTDPDETREVSDKGDDSCAEGLDGCFK